MPPRRSARNAASTNPTTPKTASSARFRKAKKKQQEDTTMQSSSSLEEQLDKEPHLDNDDDDDASETEEEEDDENEPDEVYEFNGVQYETYQDMVQAKRQRNQQVLKASGLLDTAQQLQQQSSGAAGASQRGLKRKKTTRATTSTTTTTTRRKSNRLQGIASDGLYVEDERSGKFTVAATEDGQVATTPLFSPPPLSFQPPQFYNNRLDNGSDMSLEVALTKHVAEKWQTNDALERMQALRQDLVTSTNSTSCDTTPTKGKSVRVGQGLYKSPQSVLDTLHDDADNNDSVPNSKLFKALSVDNPNHVAKVVPDRIYGMAVHPSKDQLLVCAGDKSGYIGLWNVPDDSHGGNDDDDSSVHLFKYHSGAAASLQWTTDGRSLFSTSYDGTCRLWDVHTETVRNVFAAYDDQAADKVNEAGFGLDTGYHYWTQFGCLDHRQEDCFFLSTSTGSVYHLDSRIAGKGALTWQHDLSEKKINTVSLHPNGYSLATGGLDCQVYLWDIRKFGGKKANPTPLATYFGAKSINSAFFSPSGSTLVTTTMNNKLDILKDFHLEKATSKSPKVKPLHSIRHDNMTGRWLTTFQAVWHPRYEIFGVGSMSKPRVVEIFAEQERQCAVGGEALTAVVSRLAFHPRTDQIILAGGNSSGRVTIVR